MDTGHYPVRVPKSLYLDTASEVPTPAKICITFSQHRNSIYFPFHEKLDAHSSLALLSIHQTEHPCAMFTRAWRHRFLQFSSYIRELVSVGQDSHAFTDLSGYSVNS